MFCPYASLLVDRFPQRVLVITQVGAQIMQICDHHGRRRHALAIAPNGGDARGRGYVG